MLAELVLLAPQGVEEDHGAGYVEYAIYGAPGELPALPDLEAVVGDARIEVSTTEVPDDWADRWQDFHRPLLVGELLWVRPSWEEPRASTVDIVVDPGQAFGTGAHPTTRMCLELLLELADADHARGPLADWGTGSGLLAIAAAKLGFGPVVACDHEPAALDATAANAEANGVDVRLERVNLRRDPAGRSLRPPWRRRRAIAPRSRRPARPVPEPRARSGLLVGEVDAVLAAFASRRSVRGRSPWRRRMGGGHAVGSR